MKLHKQKAPNLFAAISIGICCQIGSGWLFASYTAAKFAGAVAILSWIIGAVIALLIALMLAEISTMYHQRGLFSRLLSITHHRDFGFVFAISNWLGIVLSVSAEAVATVQYLSSSSATLHPYLYQHKDLTNLGILLAMVLLVIYGLVNYWGMRTLSKSNVSMAIIKITIPTLTAVVLMCNSFHGYNFTIYKNTVAPYGWGKAFTAVITCGIFYSFYGFSSIATFGTELKNPRRNIPLALIITILVCLAVYLLLQISFIGAVPTKMIVNGWHHINFSSPLAQLLLLVNLNFLAWVLYMDAVVSPSGSGITFAGSATRMFTGMAHDQQMPQYFDKIHPRFSLSRRSLVLTLIICAIVIFFFRNWQNVMTLTSVFYALSCLSVPLAFIKLRADKPDVERLFRLPWGPAISIVLFVLLTYLLVQVKGSTVLLALILHAFLFLIYALSNNRSMLTDIVRSFFSAWSIFIYMVFVTIFAYLHSRMEDSYGLQIIFFMLTILLYFVMIKQKSFAKSEGPTS